MQVLMTGSNWVSKVLRPHEKCRWHAQLSHSVLKY